MDPLERPFASERLRFEPLDVAHARAMFDALQDPAMYRWISGEPPVSPESLASGYARRRARLAEQHDERWLAWAVFEGDRCVGKLDADVAGAEATNVGYVFSPSCWGRGIATEAVRALVAHLGGQGVTRFRATVTVGNTASARVLEKAGFGFTRILPDNDEIRGESYDDWEYVCPTPSGR